MMLNKSLNFVLLFILLIDQQTGPSPFLLYLREEKKPITGPAVSYNLARPYSYWGLTLKETFYHLPKLK